MKYISVILLCIPLSVADAIGITPGRTDYSQREYRDGFTQGVTEGRMRNQQLWRVIGCASGLGGSCGGCYTLGATTNCFYPEYNYDGSCFFWSEENVLWSVAISGCIGGMLTGGVIYAIAGGSGDAPMMLAGESAEYTRGYIEGYKYITKKKKRNAALTGAIGGTVTGTLLMMIWTRSWIVY